MQPSDNVASTLAVLLLLWVVTASSAPMAAENSNRWPVHRDERARFRISYPPDWIIVPAKGRNVRFSVSPPKGSGNCNVVARPEKELAALSQTELNREIDALPTDQKSWAEYIGIPIAQITVVETKRGHVHTIPAIVGTIETALENLEGRFTRKQIVAMTFTPGVIWSLNCGASTFQAAESRARFRELQPTFNKVLGSFNFLQ